MLFDLSRESGKMSDAVKKILSVGGCVLIAAGTVLCALCYELLRRYDGHASPLIFPPAGRFFQQEKSGMRFAVFGDFRIQTTPFEAVMRSIRGDGADFVLFALRGGIIYKYISPCFCI